LTRFLTRLMACLLLLFAPLAGRETAAAPVAVVGEVPLVGTSLVGVQEKAVHKAMENAVDAAVREAVAASVYQASLPAIAGSLLPRAESFITNYNILGREVSDALYTVRLQVTLDLAHLRRRLTALGVLGGTGGPGRWRLVAEGVPVPVFREALSRLEIALGEEASLVPRRFSGATAEYDLVTARPLAEVVGALQGGAAGSRGSPEVVAEETEWGVSLRFPAPAGSVAAYGHTVSFYRKAPRAGEANPEDIRGEEWVPWQEAEPNDTPAQAGGLPLGAGVLGTIDPARDRDFYLVEVPPRVSALDLVVGNTGPGEFRPRARVFAGAGARGGELLWQGRSSARGRSLKGGFSLPPGVRTVLVSVEDDLARFPSAFPYRLVVSAGEKEDDR